MVSHIHYNLNADEDFVISSISKFIACFIDIHLHAFSFTSRLESQWIVYLLRGSEHIYRVLGLKGEVQSIWDLWTSGLQECKGEFFWNRAGWATTLSHDIIIIIITWWDYMGVLDRRPRPWHPRPPMMGSLVGRLGPVQMAWALAPTIQVSSSSFLN